MKQGHVSFHNAGRLGNWLFEASAAMAYALDHNMPFSAPSKPAFDRNAHWNPIYCPHLIDPTFAQSLPTITIEEKGYRFQELPWDDRWREGHNIILNGFWQSEKYFAHHRERVLEKFGFPWMKMEAWCGLHLRRGDYLIHKDKHPEVPLEWYLAQTEKFPDCAFSVYSDDPEYVREAFSGITKGRFYSGVDFIKTVRLPLADDRPEVRDLVNLSMCSHIIGSASTFAVWAGILNRNPNKRVIIPREWIKNGWQNTTAETWSDVVPTGPGWERA